ncbi:UNVERIFIED_CONTAM: hypothetical protein FKN15_061628 [Acipenser sinensis]
MAGRGIQDDVHLFCACVSNGHKQAATGVCILVTTPADAGPPVFCKVVMSRNRFLSIILRFSNIDNVRADHPLTRLELFLSMLRETSMDLVDPGQNIAINEALVLWKGRLHFRQYIKTKRA